MDRVTITQGELIAALQEALESTESPDGAWRMKDLVKALRRSPPSIYRALDTLGDRIECVRVSITDRVGRRTTVPAYRLIERPGDREDKDETQE